MIEGIEQVDGGSSSNVSGVDRTSSSGSGESGREKILNVVLLVMVFVLLGLFAYLFFSDRLVVGVENPLSKGETPTTIDNQQEESTRTGEFHLTMGYPSEYLPPYRVCFSDTSDISKVYCFVDDGYSLETGAKRFRDDAKAPNMAYENTLVEGVGVLPVGEYTMEYRMLDDVDYYVWNPCVKALNGYEVKDDTICAKYYEKLKKAYSEEDWFNFKLSYINSYGGDPITITVEEDKRTEIGDVASQPYISISFMNK
jgi:hypothetical protein